MDWCLLARVLKARFEGGNMLGGVSVAALALELEGLFALLGLLVGLQSGRWLDPCEGGKEGGG